MSSSFYSSNPKFHIAVDCIIFGFENGRLKLLLQKRNFEPHRGEWSLMGGFVQENEDVDAAAKRVLFELTGLTHIYLKQVGAFGSVGRDSGDRVVSVAYFALVNITKVDEELNHYNSAYWANLDELPPLLFDHQDMVEAAIDKLKGMVGRKPVGFNLLPPLFTLTQLQQLYEAIWDSPIDKRNFRKRITEMPFIEKTALIDKSTSKRGAALYRFNYRTYKEDEYDFKI